VAWGLGMVKVDGLGAGLCYGIWRGRTEGEAKASLVDKWDCGGDRGSLDGWRLGSGGHGWRGGGLVGQGVRRLVTEGAAPCEVAITLDVQMVIDV